MRNWRWRSLHWHMRRPASPGDWESSSQVQRCADRIEKSARPSPLLVERGARKNLCAMKGEAPWPVGKRAGKGVDQHEMCSLRVGSRRFFELAQDSSLGGIRRLPLVLFRRVLQTRRRSQGRKRRMACRTQSMK